MTELIILNKAEADANQGEYKPNYIIEPTLIAKDFYVLNRNLSKVPELADYKEAILKQPYFVIGDGSKFDLIYGEWSTSKT